MSISLADARSLEACLADGGIALIPTDTVYGIACRPDDPLAIARIYALKGRPPARPSAVLFWSLQPALASLPELGGPELGAVQALLPGPVTLLLSNPLARFPLACRPVPERLGLRVPRLTRPLQALAGVRSPILQTSANLSGGPDPHSLDEIPASILETADLVLDAGELAGVASSVVDLCGQRHQRRWTLAREGAVAAEEIAALLAPVGWRRADGDG